MTISPLILQPFYQGSLFLLLTVILVLIVRPVVSDNVWVIAGALYVVFIFSNAVLSFWSTNAWLYFFISLGVSVGYIVAIGLLNSVLIKLLKVDGTEESAAIFLVVLMHPVALLGAMFLKWLISKV